ncbi:MAG: ImmA/IrrE family metallo-endopeptidase [Chloroflexi bacterium]|nr:ImmA/IrrE family metallo-endopeptidase [Chloroflexota bacterium]
MKHDSVIGVGPEILRWARKSVGLTVADVADMLKRRPEEIEEWEDGTGAPTYPQLEKLAYQIYKRPLAIFFLPSPPEETLPQREFRTLPDADMQTLARDTYLHIRRAHAYQIGLQELFDGHNPAEHHIWKTIALLQSQDVASQATAIRDYLGISLDQQTAWKSDEQALKEWRKTIEGCGVFVFKAAFKQKDISGFCLMDEHLPVIYLNNSTTKTRQIFSLLHELAHLLLSMNGLSKFDTSYIEQLPKREKEIERFCNAIAAEVLIPGRDFANQAKLFPDNMETANEGHFSDLADRYGVSREAVLRRFLDMGRVSKAFYESKAKFWAAQKQQGGGGNWYLNQGAYISDRFAKEVVSRHYRHQISLEQAANLLGIKPKSYAGFEERILQGAEA